MQKLPLCSVNIHIIKKKNPLKSAGSDVSPIDFPFLD